MIFRAVWPITDPGKPFLSLCQDAWPEISPLLRQAHAVPTGHGRFSVAPSAHIPGSGRVTDWVLLYECPALRRPRRSIPTTPAAAASTPVLAGRPTAGTRSGEAPRQSATLSIDEDAA